MNFKQDLFDYIKDLTGFSCLDGDLNEIYDICNKERINQDNISEKLHCENNKLEKRFLNLRTLSIEEILLEIGAKGLCEPDTDCGCYIGDLAPCGVDCTKCRPASCKVATAEDVLKHPNLELDEGDFLFQEYEVIK